MRATKAFLAAIGLMALAVGCGGSSDSGTSGGTTNSGSSALGTCNHPTVNQNICYTFISGFPTSAMQSMCGTGEFSTTNPCPTAGRIGTCTHVESGQSWSIAYYPNSGTSICSGTGATWTPG